ncbi:hypothetical protein CRG98_015203 [Punica granatum]|uniref:CCHC-type domain-containing protein n=1 Tax=Punica granatum TaxID=22663 RepID=A0A2I0K791_PUNGR|nr:hypothetical protein CRG98_015203 [Punica granatum]
MFPEHSGWPRSICGGLQTYWKPWPRAMKNALMAKNKFGFIDATIAKPAETSADYARWVVCNSTLIGWIFNSLDASLQASVAYTESAQEMREDMKQRFSQGKAFRVEQIKSGLSILRQERLTVAKYYTRMKEKELWDELEDYSTVPRCTCAAAWEYAKEKVEGRMNCSHCGKSGHEWANCWKLRTCSNCGNSGHQRSNCSKLIRFPADWEQRKKIGKEQQRGQKKNMDYTVHGTAPTGEASTALSEELVQQLLTLCQSCSQGKTSMNNTLDQTTRKPIGAFNVWGGLYSFRSVTSHFAFGPTKLGDAQRWHERLGHPS